jgi:N-acetylneuraminic acid mutarotase
MWFKTVLFILSIVFVSCIDTVDSPYPNILPQSIQIPEGLERATASSFVINNKAYITLGRQGTKGSAGLTDCWEFDPENNTWTRKSDFPGKGRVGAIAEVVDGKAYIGFGFNSGSSVYGEDTVAFPDLWMYNPENDSWTRKADFPKRTPDMDAPVASCSSFVYKQWIYILTLSVKNYLYKDVWRYNTQTDKWEQMSDFPGGELVSVAVSCTDGVRYFYGTGYSGVNSNEWWEYFPETDTWKQRKSMPDAGRINALAFSVKNRFFVATGRRWGGTLTTGFLYNDIMEYDAIKDVWYKRGTIPTAGRENALAFVVGNNAFIGFGETDKVRFNDLWKFEP